MECGDVLVLTGTLGSGGVFAVIDIIATDGIVRRMKETTRVKNSKANW